MHRHLAKVVLLLALSLTAPGAAEQPRIQLHVHTPGNGHIHVAGGGIESVSVGKGSTVTVTAGSNTTTAEGDLALELASGSSGSLVVVDGAPNAIWFSNYCHQTHAVPLTTEFSSVDTGVQVLPSLVGETIVLTVTPFISYHAPSGSGTVLFRTASSEVRGASGQRIAIHAPSTRTQALYQSIFGANAAADGGFMQITPEIVAQ